MHVCLSVLNYFPHIAHGFSKLRSSTTATKTQTQSYGYSVISSPVYLLGFLVSESLSIEGAGARTGFPKLVQTGLAKHVAARQEHLHVVSIICTATAAHLRLPQLVLHAGYLLVHSRQGQIASVGLSVFQPLLIDIEFFAHITQMRLHLCIRVCRQLKLGAGLSLRQLRFSQFCLQCLYHLLLKLGMLFQLHGYLLLQIQLKLHTA